MKFLYAIVLFFFTSLGVYQQSIFEQISVEITSKQYAKGVHTTMSSEIYYNAAGRLVTFFKEPEEIVLINNKEGEYQIYLPDENTVNQKQDEGLNSRLSFFSHFVDGRLDDLGVRDLGYILKDSKEEDGAVVHTYIPKQIGRSPLHSITLVTKNLKPIYLGYNDLDQKTIRKVYFSKYHKIGDIDFPEFLTEISYVETDSIVIHTQFQNFKLNDQVELEKMNFRIPMDAKNL